MRRSNPELHNNSESPGDRHHRRISHLFFFDYTDDCKQTLDDAVRLLSAQLYSIVEAGRDPFGSLFFSFAQPVSAASMPIPLHLPFSDDREC